VVCAHFITNFKLLPIWRGGSRNSDNFGTILHTSALLQSSSRTQSSDLKKNRDVALASGNGSE
jgi:hypothetical protein